MKNKNLIFKMEADNQWMLYTGFGGFFINILSWIIAPKLYNSNMSFLVFLIIFILLFIVGALIGYFMPKPTIWQFVKITEKDLILRDTKTKKIPLAILFNIDIESTLKKLKYKEVIFTLADIEFLIAKTTINIGQVGDGLVFETFYIYTKDNKKYKVELTSSNNYTMQCFSALHERCPNALTLGFMGDIHKSDSMKEISEEIKNKLKKIFLGNSLWIISCGLVLVLFGLIALYNIREVKDGKIIGIAVMSLLTGLPAMLFGIKKIRIFHKYKKELFQKNKK